MDLSAKFGKERISIAEPLQSTLAYSTAMLSGFYAKTKVRIPI
jgi:hypothetical protein